MEHRVKTPLPIETETNPLLRHSSWALAALVVIATLLRLPLVDRPIWFDEACMSDQRIGTTPQLLSTIYTDIHPPLFVLFMHYWNSLFGDGEFAMRIPAMVSGILCIPLTFWVSHRLIGKGPAMVAAALLALSPVHVWYCTEARLYAPMITTTLFAFGAIDRLTDSRRPHSRTLWWLHLLNIAVMLSLHFYLSVIVVALAVIAPILSRGLDRSASSILLWHGIGIMLLAGFIFAKMQFGEFETSQDYLRVLTGSELFFFLFEWCWTGRTLPASNYALLRALGVGFVWLGAALSGLGLLYLAATIRQKPRALLIVLGMTLLPCFMLALVAAGFNNTYIERSLIPSLPFVFMLAAAGLRALPSKAKKLAVSITIALASLALASLYSGFASKYTLYKPHPDWRSAARYLSAQIDAGNANIPVYTSAPNPRSLSYYDPRIQDAKNLEIEITPTELAESVSNSFGDWLGNLAKSRFTEFANYNRKLLAEAQLIIRRCKPTPSELDWPSNISGDTCYVIRNEWHPGSHVDGSVEALLAHPDTSVLATYRCKGVSIYKLRVTR